MTRGRCLTGGWRLARHWRCSVWRYTHLGTEPVNHPLYGSAESLYRTVSDNGGSAGRINVLTAREQVVDQRRPPPGQLISAPGAACLLPHRPLFQPAPDVPPLCAWLGRPPSRTLHHHPRCIPRLPQGHRLYGAPHRRASLWRQLLPRFALRVRPPMPSSCSNSGACAWCWLHHALSAGDT